MPNRKVNPDGTPVSISQISNFLRGNNNGENSTHDDENKDKKQFINEEKKIKSNQNEESNLNELLQRAKESEMKGTKVIQLDKEVVEFFGYMKARTGVSARKLISTIVRDWITNNKSEIEKLVKPDFNSF